MDVFTIFLILFLGWFVYKLITYKETEIFIDSRLYVDKSNLHNSGYGVFTRSFIPKGTVIEVAHTIQIPISEREYLSTLLHYDFSCPSDEITLIGMGFSGIYNSRKVFNVDWRSTDKTITMTTNCDVYPGEELYVNYGANYFNLHGIPEEE